MRKVGCLGLLVGLGAIVALFVVVQMWGGRGPLARPISVQIAPGTSLAGASVALEKSGAIASATRFRLFAKLFGSDAPIKAGEYRIPARLSQADILKVLQGTKTIQRFVTIPEGWPSVMVKDALDRATELKGSVDVPAEGSVLPDSYAFQRGDTRAFILARMQSVRKRYLAAAWAKRAPGLAVTTPEQALILASIVEKETGKPSERAMVAAVYSNRLKRGMMLQADPTIIYPITKGRPLGRKILLSEVHAVNAYNTYAMVGLPVGPICNPGRASIDAVLNPAKSNALYFVADGSGGHVFADTLEQHNANVVKWRAYRAAHGI
ncbi:endolytic transglycosylase MltG [Sphingomonas glacialis]|uniref:Endolytic murein transglycosylase n=1 Tax=Sphingomonas glacialis TaxID=658225 RepID=A0A502FWN9_9SPHN|nr:endolytic transglycosylase MltG [Sphingomonas glacialis]TPG53915.1 endolytic transglycosylase MltG [Sphingomonas glacialis]